MPSRVIRRRLDARKRRARGAMAILSRISVGLAERWAEALFRTPPRQKPTRAERRVLDGGKRTLLRAGRRSLWAWRWGNGGPRVLLVHGWGGHAGRLAAFVAPLCDAGYGVVAVEAPAHGESGGRRASLPDFARAILAADRELGPFHGLIGHSMGAAGAALAIRDGLRVGRAVFLAPPADPEEFSVRFARALGLPGAVRDGMKRRLERRYAARWAEVKLIACAPETPVPLLIVHDARDREVPLRDAGAILLAWRGATIVRTRGLGHHKIARDRSVVEVALGFLSAGEREKAQLA